jgi:uncharacterized protein (DUF305 family)
MKTTTWLALLGALAIIAIVAVVVGFGGDDGKPSSAAGNATDAAFVTDMTAHHQGAIEMAELAQNRADHAEVRTLADDIVSAQQGEISTMKAIGDDMHSMGMHDGGHMGMSEHAMGMDMDMHALENAKPFDKAFIDAMVPHHQGAIAMAEDLLKEGEQPALRKMAGDIISAQTKEIAQMKQWRKTWYGSANVPTDMSGDGSMDDMDMGG